jgi:hypothetical protein
LRDWNYKRASSQCRLISPDPPFFRVVVAKSLSHSLRTAEQALTSSRPLSCLLQYQTPQNVCQLPMWIGLDHRRSVASQDW